jgi:hypothetical protein
MKTTILLGLTIATALAGEAALAQTHKVTTPDSVVRAIGVYEWTGDLAKPTASRLVPVSLFIDGQLQDAGIYMPRPVPFALVSGNVYELEDAGLPKGIVELESAIHMTLPEGSPGAAFDEGWMGYGSYKPPVAARKSATPLRPAKTLPVITTSSSDSGRPHLTNKSDDASKTGSSTDSQQQGTSKNTDPNAKPGTGTASDDSDRPTMRRRDSADTTASTGGSGQTSSDDDAERPTLKRRSPEDAKDAKDNKKKGDVATVTASGSLNDDPDRPTLHHGSSGGGSGTEMPKLMGVPKDMHQMVAVSDAKDRDPHPFARPWESDNERAAVLAKMQGFARAKLALYGIVPGVTPPSAIAGTSASPSSSSPSSASAGANKEPEPPTLKRGIPTTAKKPSSEPSAPATTKAPATAAKSNTATTKSRRSATANAPQVVLADEELKGYLLSYGGAPTYVYMAHTDETGSVMRYVTIVAQADAMGELKLAMASVTDAAHLDRTPWMRLVDAVDVEASNRASLLFEMRGQTSRQFALYRVIATKPEQIFQTGSPM